MEDAADELINVRVEARRGTPLGYQEPSFPSVSEASVAAVISLDNLDSGDGCPGFLVLPCNEDRLARPRSRAQ